MNIECNTVQYCQRKADQHWEMAALAIADGDYKDSERHLARAEYWQRQAKEAIE